MSVLEERRLNRRIVERRWWDIGVGSCRSCGDGSVGNGRAVVAGASEEEGASEEARRDLTIISYSDGASFSRDSSSCGGGYTVIHVMSLCVLTWRGSLHCWHTKFISTLMHKRRSSAYVIIHSILY